ncbi:MAG: hypothetical protein ACE5KM_03550 [Planctomycetaceae bacterium]
MLRTFLTACVPVVLWVGISGCSSSKDTPLAPFTGQVTYKGRPVANATITIQPENGSLGFAQTDTEGKFVAKTGAKDGVAVGQCTITVEAFIGGGGGGGAEPTIDEGSAAQNPNAGDDMRKRMMNERTKKGAAPKSLIPAKYGKLATTPLKGIEIPASGKTDYEIKLTD